MATSPQFINTPRYAQATVSAANTAFDGTGTIVSLITGAATGTRVTEIRATASGTTVDSIVNLFMSSDNGATWKYYRSLYIWANTVSATNPPSSDYLSFTNLVLPSASHKIGASITVAQSVTVHAVGGDL